MLSIYHQLFTKKVLFPNCSPSRFQLSKKLMADLSLLALCINLLEWYAKKKAATTLLFLERLGFY